MEINREEFSEVVVNIGRVTKVVKGGRSFRLKMLLRSISKAQRSHTILSINIMQVRFY